MESLTQLIHSILYYNTPVTTLDSLQINLSGINEINCKEILQFLKDTIKAKKNPPVVKLQALKLIDLLMNASNPTMVQICGKKLFNRFKILAEYKKEVKVERRGTLLFNASTALQQTASEDFLILLLQCIKLWSERFPSDHKGKPSYYLKLFNYLKSKNVSFPVDRKTIEKGAVLKRLMKIRGSVKKLMDLMASNENPVKISKIGKKLRQSHLYITERIVKYMEMEDHELIKELNQCLDLLTNGKRAFKSWKGCMKRNSVRSLSIMPQVCAFLKDLNPKDPPAFDELSESILGILPEENSPILLLTDRETEYERENTLTEWTGLGADYCKLKDRLEASEKSIEALALQYSEELHEKEQLEREIDRIKEINEAIQRDAQTTIRKLTADIQQLKETLMMYSESQKEAESTQELLRKEILEKDKELKASEANNLILASNCKNLEEQIQQYTENEVFLKKEIKELFKKIEKKSSSSCSSISEKVVNNNESPVKDIKVSLLGKEIEVSQRVSVLSIEENLTEPAIEENDVNLLSPMGLLPSRVISSSFSQVDNLYHFKECLKRHQGVIYENSSIKISISIKVSDFHGKANISIENNSTKPLNRFKTKVYSDPFDGISISIDQELTQELLPEHKAQRKLSFDCSEIYQIFPLLKLTFKTEEEEKQQIVLLLPITYMLFCSRPAIEFIREWETIEEYRETICKTDVDSIKHLTRSVLFNKNFDYSYIEGNGVLIATKSPIGLALALIILKDSQAFIQVKAKNTKLRDLLSSMIATQVVTLI